MNYAAYLSYIFLASFTPGPNNIMAMSNAGRHGFKKGFRFNLGVLFGMLIVLTICAAFTSLLYGLVPQIEPIMICIGAAYILWLAWSVWRDSPHGDEKKAAGSIGVVSGMMLQLVNIKGILYGITGMSTFVLPHYRGAYVVPFIIIMAFVGFAGTCLWALFGAAFESFFSKHRKITNALMALLLVYCALSLLVGLF